MSKLHTLIGATAMALALAPNVQKAGAQTIEHNIYTGQSSPTDTGISITDECIYRHPSGKDSELGTVDDDLRPCAANEAAFEGTEEHVNLYGEHDTWKSAYSPNSSVLPVEITSYKAVQNNGRARLSWTATSEHSIAVYSVRQTNRFGHDEVINEVKAQGTRDGPREYTAVDETLEDNLAATDTTTQPTVTYQVNAVNVDGSVDKAFNVSLKRRIDELDATVAPNPVQRQTTLTYDNPERQDLTMNVYDVLGRSVYSRTFSDREAGTHATHIDASRFASGQYFIRLRSDDGIDTERFTVVR